MVVQSSFSKKEVLNTLTEHLSANSLAHLNIEGLTTHFYQKFPKICFDL